MIIIVFIILTAISYLGGSIPFGKVVGRHYGIDIQKHGSGNIGFANAVRVLGWKPAVLVLVGDMGKGFVPVWIAQHFVAFPWILVVAFAAVVGHIFPVWLGFRGGKGIATGMGVTLALVPSLGVLAMLVYLAGFGLFQKSAPSSLMSMWSLAMVGAVMRSPYYFAFFGLLAVLTTWTHRTNIREMWAARRHA
ncbi:MAG TPA: glycerol-3-phosphate 1-O-acyltransferase PlsY [Candidatus Saccharimonadia bacterium]|jgi:glycerol-3-phosphate acyltransferase PlsY|nr:glycerol-3-phosphate 1-O-acyltransferase PlsY [Candidatus Saccharimonadia bacterium]